MTKAEMHYRNCVRPDCGRWMCVDRRHHDSIYSSAVAWRSEFRRMFAQKRKRVAELEEAIKTTIARADDYADSHIPRPIRDVMKAT